MFKYLKGLPHSMPQPFLSGHKLLRYAETRLFGSNIGPEEVKAIIVHNGMLPSEMRKEIGICEQLSQSNPREPIYFKEGTLHIPQYSGFGRKKRYERLIDAYIKESGRDITHIIDTPQNYRDGDPVEAAIFYENLAYDLLKPIFTSPQTIDVIIFGNKKIKKKMLPQKILQNAGSEYLDAQLFQIGEKNILNMGYVYADQAGILTNKALRWSQAKAELGQEKKAVDIFMFGRVGGLADTMRRNELVYPDGIINQADLEDRAIEPALLVTPMHNILADPHGHRGWNLNVMSVLDETKILLKKAKTLGCICTEMETFEVVSAMNVARTRYREHLKVEFGFVGYISDNPLRGDTLDVELDSDAGERKAVKRILEKLL